MKTLPNVQFSLKANANDPANATVASLVKLTLCQTPPQGFDFSTMRARQRVADALDKLSPDAPTIELEDADFATARQCVEAFKWGSYHPELLQLAKLFDL